MSMVTLLESAGHYLARFEAIASATEQVKCIRASRYLLKEFPVGQLPQYSRTVTFLVALTMFTVKRSSASTE